MTTVARYPTLLMHGDLCPPTTSITSARAAGAIPRPLVPAARTTQRTAADRRRTAKPPQRTKGDGGQNIMDVNDDTVIRYLKSLPRVAKLIHATPSAPFTTSTCPAMARRRDGAAGMAETGTHAWVDDDRQLNQVVG